MEATDEQMIILELLVLQKTVWAGGKGGQE
jgi:hypothetical protein